MIDTLGWAGQPIASKMKSVTIYDEDLALIQGDRKSRTDPCGMISDRSKTMVPGSRIDPREDFKPIQDDGPELIQGMISDRYIYRRRPRIDPWEDL